MVVVLWERRAPEDPSLRPGTVLQTNREVLLDLLYGNERPLIGTRRANTIVAVYPEGFPAERNDPTLYERLRESTPEQILAFSLPRMVAMPESTDRLRGIYYVRAPAREQFDADLRRNVTAPLLGINRTDVDESSFEGRPDQRATRGVSFPPLVTPWAVHDAAVRAGSGPPFGEVYVVWVLAGDKDYDQSLPDARISLDLGPSAARLYDDAKNVFAVNGDESRRGVAVAHGCIRVFRISNVRTNERAPQLRLVQGPRPASLDFTARWETPWLSSLPVAGNFLRRWPFFASLADLPTTRWPALIEPSGYKLLPGRFRWSDGTAATGMTAAGTMAEDIQAVVTRRLQNRNVLRDDLVAEALAEPEPEAAPPDVRSLWVPIVSYVQAGGKVTVTLRAIELWVYALAAIVLAAVVVAIVWYYLPRDLHVAVQWPDAVNFPLGRAEDSIVVRPQLILQDRSGLPRRPARIEVTLAIGRAVAGVPLLADAPFASLSPTRLHVHRLSRRSAEQGIPIDIRVSGRAVDLRRVTAGSHHYAAITLRAVVTDNTKRYRSAIIESPYVFDVTIGAADPDADRLLTAGTISPIKERGLFHDSGGGSRKLHVGWLRIENVASPGFVARDVVVRLDAPAFRGSVNGAGVTLDVQPQIVAAGNVDPRRVMLKNAEREYFDVYITAARGAVPPSVASCEIEVHASFRLAEGAEKWRPLPPRTIPFLWFPFVPTRHACLDLGTSAVRLLREGGTNDPDRWGYALFDRPPLNESPLKEDWPPEDLPSFVLFDGNGRAHLGQEALRGETSDRFHVSVKNVMIDDRPGREGEIRAFVEEFFRKYYVPLIQHASVVRNPYSDAEEQIVAGNAEVLVASIPNDCSARYRDAFEKALVATKCFRQVSLLHEAEAVSIWYSSWRLDQRLADGRKSSRIVAGRAAKTEVIVVDVGAGTTDSAWTEITDEGGLKAPSIRIRSIGAAALAGRFIDNVIVDELVRLGWIDRDSLSRLSQRKRLELGEGVKVAIARGDATYVRPAVNLSFRRLELDAGQLMTIARSDAYRNAIDEIAAASLSILLGRLPSDVDLRDRRTLLLTGRGSRMFGMQEAVVRYLATHGVNDLSVADVPESLLKASITIGCRSFAVNYWSELKKASDASLDRILLIYRDGEEVNHREMVASDTPVDQPGPWVEVPQWSEAKLIATHLRTDALFDDPHVLLDERKIRQMLDGTLQAPRRQWHSPYSVLLGSRDLPRSEDSRRLQARVVYRRDGVDIEERPVFVESKG